MTTISHHQHLQALLSRGITLTRLLCLLSIWATAALSFAGDSTYGTIVEVKSADVVVLDTGAERYTVRLIGIEMPTQGTFSKRGKQLVSKLILKKRVQMRFEYRNESQEMVSRLLTLQTAKAEISDVGEVLVRAGLAKRQDGFDYKCGCLTKAEKEAIASKRGIWAAK